MLGSICKAERMSAIRSSGMGSVISDGHTDTALILPMPDVGSSFLRNPN